jgi:hypothetical protein
MKLDTERRRETDAAVCSEEGEEGGIPGLIKLEANIQCMGQFCQDLPLSTSAKRRARAARLWDLRAERILNPR